MIISKPQGLSLLIIFLLCFPSLVNIGHALYTVALPSNTIYADDFENYPVNTILGGNGTNIGQGGWFSVDRSGPGVSVINGTQYQSCCHSLEIMAKQSGASGVKWDLDRRFGLITNQTRIINVSGWFAFSASINNATTNGFHIALESWDFANHWECVTLFGATSSANNGAYPIFDYGPSGQFVDSGIRYTAFDSNPLTQPSSENAIGGYWHHISLTCNIVDHVWGAVNIDGFSYLDIQGQAMRPIGSSAFSPNRQRNDLRLELAVSTNGAVPSGGYAVFWDNIILTDVTPGQPNIIQFGIVSASGLFQLILITTAMMYISSGFGAVMRVFAKDKVPKFLGPKFIIVTGVVGTAGFLFMLIVGANLVKPACPPGFTCVG